MFLDGSNGVGILCDLWVYDLDLQVDDLDLWVNDDLGHWVHFVLCV